MVDEAAARARAEELVRETWSAATVAATIPPLHSSQKSTVWRLIVQGESAPPTVIAKVVDQSCADLYARELGVLSAAAGLGITPRLYVSDDTYRLLILEDLGVAGDESALALGLATLHASTRRISGRFPMSPHQALLSVAADILIAEVRAVARAIGVTWEEGVSIDVPHLLDALRDESLSCLSHGDVCVANARLTGSGARLIDFPDAGRGSPAIDVAALQLGLPACGRAEVVDAERATVLVERYRRSVVGEYPEWHDAERFRAYVGVGCGFWALRILAGRWMDPRRVIRTHPTFAPELTRQLRLCSEVLDRYPGVRAIARSVESEVRARTGA